MKIKKGISSKRAKGVPNEHLESLIKTLTKCDLDTLISLSKTTKTIPKSDFYSWIPVLNRFDSILEAHANDSSLFTPNSNTKNKLILLAVLNLTRLLYENCTSRNLYASFDHLADLLYSKDLDILLATIKLLFRPAQRIAIQRSARSGLQTVADRVNVLATNNLPQLDRFLDSALDELSSVQTNQNDPIVLFYSFYLKIEKDSKPITPSVPVTPASSSTVSQQKPVASPLDVTPQQKRSDQVDSFSTPAPPIPFKTAAQDDRVTIQLINPHLRIVPAQTALSNKKEKRASSSLAASPLGEFKDRTFANEKELDLVKEYKVPKDHQFPLYHRLRLCLICGDQNQHGTSERFKLIMIRLLSIAVWVNIIPEETAQQKLFLYEPKLIQRCAEILGSESLKITSDLQTAAICVMDSISHYKGKNAEVLQAINASVSHGVLMFSIQKVVDFIKRDDVDDVSVVDKGKQVSIGDGDKKIVSQEFIDAVFGFVGYLVSLTNGGPILTGAGLIPLLVSVMDQPKVSQRKNVIRCMSMLDSILYQFPNTYPAFLASRGLEHLVHSIQVEVQTCSEENDGMDLEQSQKNEDVIPIDRITFLRSLLKFILHLMQTSGTADGVRNLIDTTLPKSILTIFTSPKFGASIYGLAVNIMSTFIHNEPTSLSILQELGVPQAFLKVAHSELLPISAEVVSALPNAFGAVCLNQAGLEQFKASNPLKRFLDIFTMDEHIVGLLENDVPHVVGSSLDEFVRHHPSLKTGVFSAIDSMLKDSLEIGRQQSTERFSGLMEVDGEDGGELSIDELEYYELFALKVPTDGGFVGDDGDVVMGEKVEEVAPEKPTVGGRNVKFTQYIEVLSRLLDGLFQNTQHAKEFTKSSAMETLLEFCSLRAIPFDFSNLSDSYSLGYIFRILIDANPTSTVNLLIKFFDRAYDSLAGSGFLEFDGKDEAILPTLVEVYENDATLSVKQEIVRNLITLQCITKILVDVFTTHVLSTSKTITTAVQLFGDEGKLIRSYAKLHRVCVWEGISLKSRVKDSWFESQKSSKDKKAATPQPLTPLLPHTGISNGVSTASPVVGSPFGAVSPSSGSGNVADQKDFRVKNTQILKSLVTQLPNQISVTIQSVVKCLTGRKAMESSSKAVFPKILEGIASEVVDHIIWQRVWDSSNFTDKFNYFGVMLTYFSIMITSADDRSNHNSLQTGLVNSFINCSGMDTLVTVFSRLWEQSISLNALSEIDFDSKYPKNPIHPPFFKKDFIELINATIATVVSIFQTFTDAKLLFESPYTAILAKPPGSDSQKPAFDPRQHLIKVRLAVIEQVKTIIWDKSDILKSCSVTVAKKLIKLVIQILKAEGEVRSPELTLPLSLSSSAPMQLPRPQGIFPFAAAPRPAVVADPVKVQQLIDMGFPRGAALVALVRTGNHLSRAADYLLEHPEVVSAVYPVLPAEPIPVVAAGVVGTSSSIETPPVATGSGVLLSSDPLATNAVVNSDVVDEEDGDGDDDEEDNGDDDDDDDDDPMDEDSAELEAALRMSMEANAEPVEIVVVDEPIDVKGKAVETAVETQKEVDAPKPPTSLEILDAIRKELKTTLLEKVSLLLDLSEEYIFEVKDLIEGNLEGSFEETITFLLKEVGNYLIQLNDTALYTRLRLFALIVLDNKYGRKAMSFAKTEFITTLFAEVEKFSKGYSKITGKVVCAMLLIIESAISIGDEIKSVELNRKPVVGYKEPEKLEEVESLSFEFRVRLMEYSFKILDREDVEQDSVIALNRILVRLTRNQKVMVEFINLNASRLLFQDKWIAKFPSQPSLTMLVLRHIVESQEMAQTLLEHEIAAIFKADGRQKVLDLTTFIKSTSHLIIRDPELFVSTTKNLCQLLQFESWGRQKISLKPKPTVDATLVISPKDVKSLEDTPVEVVENPEDVTATTSLESIENNLVASQNADSLAQYLVSEILLLREFPGSTTTLSDSKIEVDDTIHIRRCFLLHCLGELISSYPSFKLNIMTASLRKGKNSTAHKKNSFLSHLLNDLLPCGTGGDMTLASTKDASLRKKSYESSYAVLVLVGLAIISDDAETEKRLSMQLNDTRKVLFETIARSMKDSISSTCGVEERYGKFLSLAEICHKILIASDMNKPRTASGVVSEEMLTIVKLMLEKNIVQLFTQMLNDVDIQHPDSSGIIHSILQPLEILTKVATKTGKLDHKEKKSKTDGDIIMTEHTGRPLNLSDHQGTQETQNAFDDVYRNSALGLFAAAEDNHPSSESSDDDGGGLEFEDEYTDDEEESEDDDDDEQESDVEDEMEIVIPASYHNAHEPRSSESEGEEDDDLEGDMHDIPHDDNEEGWSDVDSQDDQHNPHPNMHEIADRVIMQMGEELSDDEDHESDDEENDDGEGHGDEDDDHEGEHEDSDDDDDAEEQPADGVNMMNIFGDDGDNADDDVLEPHILVNRNDRRRHTNRIRRHLLEGLEENPNFEIQFNDRHGLRQGILEDNLREFEILGRPAGANAAARNFDEDFISHPLLEAQPSLNPLRIESPNNLRLSRNGDFGESNPFHQIFGGNGMNILQQIIRGAIARNPGRNSYRVSVNAGPADLLRARGLETGLAPITAEVEDDRLTLLHSLHQLLTTDRWKQEARMMYGKSYLSKASRIVHSLINALEPIAREQEQKRKEVEEEAKRVREEAEKKKQEELERLKEEKRLIEEELAKKKKEEEDRLAAEAAALNDARMEEAGGSTDISPMAVEATPEQPAARITVSINGVDVDITDSGIDASFLEALPDDMRAEVLAQHLREQGQVTGEPSQSTAIDRGFLDALPDDIREEILMQDRVNARAAARGAANAEEIDPASFLAALDPRLRQTVLLEQDNDMLSAISPGLAAEALNLRNLLSRQFASRGGGRVQSRRTAGEEVRRYRGIFNESELDLPSSSAKKLPASRESVQLVDKLAIMSLLRLLFVPEPVNKALTFRLLANISENSKTRSDLLVFLLYILNEGCVDLNAVDKAFSVLSNHKKAKHGTPKKIANFDQSNQTNVGVPNLVELRCLEIMNQLVVSNDQSIVWLVTENDHMLNALNKTPKSSKKNKGKLTVNNKLPVCVLLGLLEKPSFLENSSLLEQLVHLLSIVMKPLPVSDPVKSTPKADVSSTLTDVTPPLTEHPTIPVVTDSNVVEIPAAESTSDYLAVVTPALPTVEATVASKKDVVVEEKPVVTFKLPLIPNQSIRAVVGVLTRLECSNKTFQYTLSIIQHLMSSKEFENIVIQELTTSVHALGGDILPDLIELASVIESSASKSDLRSSILGKFSKSSAIQSKLLRVLKTLDFVHSKTFLSNIKGSRPSSPTPIESGTSSTAVAVEEKKNGQEMLKTIFAEFNLSDVWISLGKCLEIINAKSDDLMNVGTVLLPLIEGFMVVSKPYIYGKATLSPVSFKKDIKLLNNEERFVVFTEEHRKILNLMVRNNPGLMNGSFSLLVQNPKVLDFDNKRTYFKQQLHKRVSREHYNTLQINVRRPYVFEDSYHQLQGKTGKEIKFGKLSIRFYEEEGVDVGGVTREWFSVLARQMFNPNYALFKPSAVDKITYQPNRSSWINPDHLYYFKFVGRIIGKSIFDGKLLDCYFTRSFYKSILGIPVDWKDMEAVDPEYHKSLEWMSNNDITDVLDLTFSCEVDDFGRTKIVDLKPGGSEIQVTEENKQEYVTLITAQRLEVAIAEQITAFLSGFQEIIPSELIKIFNEQELELLISGLPDIDVDDWKSNAEYQNYSSTSIQVQWFWRVVRSFTQEERAKLIQFITGTSKVPLEGFSNLQGSSGIQKFQIHKDFSSKTRLPSAHTCFNQLDLPEYDSYEQLRTNLLIAMNEGATGFGFA